jgi:putative phosphoribosyl transferase
MIDGMAMTLRHTDVDILAGEQRLEGILAFRATAPALIVQLERGSSTLKTSRGAFVVDTLNDAGFATLNIALLSREEERKAPEVWRQVATLTTRIDAVLEWLSRQSQLENVPLGMVARDAATAAMIRVAARTKTPLRALASRGGRPDLAGLEPLKALATPLLLVAGELDDEGPGPNQQAFDHLSCARDLAIVKGASHAFEELGTLEEATQHIIGWLRLWLPG